MSSPTWLIELLSLGVEAPISANDSVRSAVRNLLRYGGFKPTGRSKPASEYLLKMATDSKLESINAAVDACNAVSLHSGLPISVVDSERLGTDLRIGIGSEGDNYVFNASGQSIELDGLVCLFDQMGPCANAVKDSQRTKTHAATTKTLCIVWGSSDLGDRTKQAVIWYQEILRRLNAVPADYQLSNPELRKL